MPVLFYSRFLIRFDKEIIYLMELIVRKLKGFINISRPENGLMAVIGVSIGFWLSNNSLKFPSLVFLNIIALMALSYGNVINDIKDLPGDSINHPKRPLPLNILSIKEAYIYSITLAALSLTGAFYISPRHFAATLIPILLLTLYTVNFKGIPLLGNIIISLLVSYTLIFGGLGAKLEVIFIPAILAFILNLQREIIKDLEDKEGDLLTGVKTTAVLSTSIIKVLLVFLSLIYIVLLPFPYFNGDFSSIYLFITLFTVLPFHFIIVLGFSGILKKLSPSVISKLIKIEMILGLASLAIDKFLK